MSELDGFEVLPTFDERTNRGKIGYRSKRIAELEERVSELESLVRDLLPCYLWSDCCGPCENDGEVFAPCPPIRCGKRIEQRAKALGIEVD